MSFVSEEMARIKSHEEICTLRHNAINARLKRMESWLILGVTSTLGLCITIILHGRGLL